MDPLTRDASCRAPRDGNNVNLNANELLIIRYKPIARFVEDSSVLLL